MFGWVKKGEIIAFKGGLFARLTPQPELDSDLLCLHPLFDYAVWDYPEDYEGYVRGVTNFVS